MHHFNVVLDVWDHKVTACILPFLRICCVAADAEESLVPTLRVENCLKACLLESHGGILQRCIQYLKTGRSVDAGFFQ